ncbi:3' terminal RNA ribose 2'-O-methyltransferase Hen1 [Phytoactinopolyspora mesophila]|uniref:Small RNA 2'-O-methyltransferase n=1 Tax=Phytoactinopolyspora mesophila TaxID=2650750 RepID=A0A7K3M9H7_9ACTN|nr:3' terminal RNA ribose 2'-O-methyltransferase Hen1 [Phytoactinopolyspora mesophila]
MYVTITSTAESATDLGYLLHKHPDRAQQFTVSTGVVHVFYPEATPERCTVALVLEVDPIGLVRGRRHGGDAFALSQYVNDRPYAASSMLAVALGKVFRTAMAGKCAARPDLVDLPLPLEIHVPALPSVGGAAMVADLFEPLGWSVEASPIPLDETMPAWGDSRYLDLRLRGTVVLAQALSHLYVLLPVLDDAKHYWVSSDEVDKLIRSGSGWLAGHPRRELITRRFLVNQRELVSAAVARLAEADDLPPEALDNAVDGDSRTDDTVPLVVLRRQAVLEALHTVGAARVVDLGCGEGALLRDLIEDARFSEILGVDVSPRALQVAERRLNLDRMPDSQRARLRLLQSSLTYRDQRLAGYDAIVLMEVIEHLDPARLPALEKTVFTHARPGTVVVTTPNAEHNVRYEGLRAGTMRHRDHRFEWTRAEFAGWAEGVCASSGYHVRFVPIGDDDPEVGPPTQMAVFSRNDETERQAS